MPPENMYGIGYPKSYETDDVVFTARIGTQPTAGCVNVAENPECSGFSELPTTALWEWSL